MDLKKMNDRVFATEDETMFYYRGMADPYLMIQYPESIHISLMNIPLPVLRPYTTYQRKSKPSYSNKQMFAYLDSIHLKLTGKPFNRLFLVLYAINQPTIANALSCLQSMATNMSAFQTAQKFTVPAGFDRGNFSQGI